MDGKPRTAVVTGGNRGLGLEICRELARLGYQVVLTSRDRTAGEKAVQSLMNEGLRVVYQPLDVTDPQAVRELKMRVDEEFGGADVLVNNAAVYLDAGTSVFKVGRDVFQMTMKTNVEGPFTLCQAFIPGMMERRYGRVVNVSSTSGQLSSMGDYSPTYAISKTALNGVTRVFADAARGKNVLVNSVHPGWVRTEMGGRGAPRSVEQGADTVIWLATLPDSGPTGGFFYDRKPIPW